MFFQICLNYTKPCAFLQANGMALEKEDCKNEMVHVAFQHFEYYDTGRRYEYMNR